MKFACPHCGEKSFTPLQKAFAGSYRGMGKPCPNCGKRCCNGMEAIYFDAVISLIAFIIILIIYFKFDWSMKLQSSLIIGGIIIASLVISFIFKMFFGDLVPPIRKMR